MKKIFFLTFLFSCILANGQVDILDNTSIQLYSHVNDWEPSMRTYVNTVNGTGYNLWSNVSQRDVSFFHASGYLWCLQGGFFGSDIRLKRNVTNITNPIETINRLNGVRYQFKPDNANVQREYDTMPGNGFRFGLIAQDVELVLPEVVKTLPDGTKAITYTDLIPILIEAVKRQQVEIAELRELVNRHETSQQEGE